MKIVIPMSGTGERFKKAGYTVPKPLINVDGKAIIEHVIDMYPGESDFIFICNVEHLNNPDLDLEAIIKSKCPTGTILGIEPHKLGPVYAILKASRFINNDEPVIVNYCDFTCYWNYEKFKDFVSASDCDGAIAVYTGFHPHMLRSVNFAYVQRSASGLVTNIQEKLPFTTTPMNECASSGTYYFKSGRLLLDYAKMSMVPELALNGEYYVSMVYKPMLDSSLKVHTYEIEHFMQWGTPEDLAEYTYYSTMFSQLLAPRARARHSGTTVLPMAGLGSRFSKAGYQLPKPLIPVGDYPMAVQAATVLPEADKMIFILRRDTPAFPDILSSLQFSFSDAAFVVLNGATDGQAVTALSALDQVDPDLPLTIGPCDSGLIYDPKQFTDLLNNDSVDIIVWTARHYPGAAANPTMYGWVDTSSNGDVRGVSVKAPLADSRNDPIVTGTFTFKKAAMFKAAVEHMVKSNRMVNGEYYIDSCINDAILLGLRVKCFDVLTFMCWGTPDDLKRFEYWRSCFSKWSSHPYSLRPPTFSGLINAIDRT